jgi:hypothetical protein
MSRQTNDQRTIAALERDIEEHRRLIAADEHAIKVIKDQSAPKKARTSRAGKAQTEPAA